MGEIADYYIERMLEEAGRLGGNMWDADTYGHPLDNNFWITAGGDQYYPAKGEMSEYHIQNTMNLMRKAETIDAFREIDIRLYGYSKVDFKPVGEEHIRTAYFMQRIQVSILWAALQQGLEYHKKLKQKTNDLNKGILEL